jgi:hypothetical protein
MVDDSIKNLIAGGSVDREEGSDTILNFVICSIPYHSFLDFYFVGSLLEQDIFTKVTVKITKMNHLIVHVILKVMVHILYQLLEEVLLQMQMYLVMATEQ